MTSLHLVYPVDNRFNVFLVFFSYRALYLGSKGRTAIGARRLLFVLFYLFPTPLYSIWKYQFTWK